MKTSYEADVVAWASEQARLIRAGRFDQLDLAHIAEEIEDVGKSEQRELASRMAVLLAHILKWKFQPQKRSVSWTLTIKEQRRLLVRRIQKTPSLGPMLVDPEWIDEIWVDAKALAEKETGLDIGAFPEVCPWDMAHVLTEDWLPE
ncbi:DUF29 domain-containing protein [Polaromonas naphthalenivorans]|uniref:DUF29 domain-containing protein n=1 Tax=Polaromonas naphthalenivorans (strain CJ2) TaxID=365044 RepID=A1VX69_POLNA|nr:DUF29 domain-containing protein [Polaromonas naphthalenivorans]ABM40247.1 protein of unknown function DUF29 [Polaromonas naphthalenivorans CJ2]